MWINAVIIGLWSVFGSQPNLRVYVLGDSISIHYGPYFKEYLAVHDLDYFRKGGEEAIENLDIPQGANGGDSRMVLSYVRKLLDDPNFQTDLFLVNCGLHDIKTRPGDTERQVSDADYRANLDTLFSLLKGQRFHTIFINTTPVIDSIHNGRMAYFHRYNTDVLIYNGIAQELAASHKLSYLDLYSFTKSLGKAEMYNDHVHFKDRIRKLQAAYLVGWIVGMNHGEK